MKVAVARMKNAGDPQVVALADLGKMPEDVGKLGARHDPILGAVGGRETSDGSERRFTALPDGDVLGLLARSPHDRFTDGAAMRLHDLANGLRFAVESGVEPV